MADMILSRVEEKLRLLLKKMQFLQEENTHLEKELAQKNGELQMLNEHLIKMEHQLTMQKIAARTMECDGSDTNSTDRSELKKMLNIYIREIDHCIARLNE